MKDTKTHKQDTGEWGANSLWVCHGKHQLSYYTQPCYPLLILKILIGAVLKEPDKQHMDKRDISSPDM